MKRMKASVLILLFLWCGYSTYAQESKFKALFIYKFAEYIEWSSKPYKIVVGVAGTSDVQAQLSSFAANRDNLEVITISSTADAQKCNIVFLPESEEKLLSGLVEGLKNSSILLVSENRHLVRKGADIGFFLEDGKLRFIINPKSIENKNMMPNSKLLALGETI